MPSSAFPSARASRRECAGDVAQPPWLSDTVPGYGPGASMLDVAPADSPRQGELPAEYRLASDAELDERIRAAKRTLAGRVLVLGHFYQRDEIIRHADFVGDSYRLARAAKEHSGVAAIVFCGVHFMAETADILTSDEQAVLLPNLAAGCSMADMADRPSVERAWRELSEALDGELGQTGSAPAVPAVPAVPTVPTVPTVPSVPSVPSSEQAGDRAAVVPVTYMNSSAALKAFCGEHGGIVCTSANAQAVLEWAFERGERVLFFPDQHLGRNTALEMGIPAEQILTWNPRLPLGGHSPEAIARARVIVWHGFCSVHRRFTLEQVEKARREFPGVRVVVHPECVEAVVAAADEVGSTERIVKAVEHASPGTTFAIGTEINLVRRLAAEHPEHHIFCLDPVICPCSTMYRIHPSYLAWVLEALVAGERVNQIRVPADVAEPARLALDRMLEVSAGRASAPPPASATALSERVAS